MAKRAKFDTYAAEFARKGGVARAEKLSKLRQSEIARVAALARWANHKKGKA